MKIQSFSMYNRIQSFKITNNKSFLEVIDSIFLEFKNIVQIYYTLIFIIENLFFVFKVHFSIKIREQENNPNF